MRVHLTIKSENVKTGPIPVSTSSAETCPPACPLAGAGCYAQSGKLSIHWRKVSAAERGEPWHEFLARIRQLPPGQIWRHNQAGATTKLETSSQLDPIGLTPRHSLSSPRRTLADVATCTPTIPPRGATPRRS